MEAGGGKNAARLDEVLEKEFEIEVREHLAEVDGDEVDLTTDRPDVPQVTATPAAPARKSAPRKAAPRKSPPRRAAAPRTAPAAPAATPAPAPAAATAPAPPRRPEVPAPAGRRTFGFAAEPRVAPFSVLAGVLPRRAKVEVRDGTLSARFGIWSVETPLDNVEAAEVTGPYSLLKVAGPPHLSLKDRGLTFATTTKRGVCIRFKEPVKAGPVDLLAHPSLTVTVDDPQGLVDALS